MKKHILFFILALFCYGDTLDELISKAHQNNPEINKIKDVIDLKVEDVKLSNKYDNPMITISVNDISLNEPAKRDLEPMMTQSVIFSQKLPFGDRLNISKKISVENLSLEELKLIKKIISLTYDVKKTVYKIKKLENDINIIKQYEKTLDEIINMHTLYNIDSSNHHYQATLKSSILKTKLDLKKIKTQNDLETEKSTLKELVNDKINTIDTEYILSDTPDLTNLTDKAENNIDILIKKKELKISQLDIEHAQSLKTQDITLGAGYFNRDSFNDFLAVSVTVPLNIYDRENIAVVKSMKKRDSKVNEMQSLKNSIENDLTASYYNIKNAKDEYQLLNKIILSQQEIISILLEKSVSKDLLKEGYSVIKDILDIEFDKNAKIFSYNLNMAKAQMLTGETK